MATRTLPDVERLVVDYLLSRSEVTDLCGDRVGTLLDLTEDAELPAIRVRRISSTTPVRRHLRRANMQLETWAPDELQAQDLAEIAHAVLQDDWQSTPPGLAGDWRGEGRGVYVGVGVVTDVANSIDPRSQPDPDTSNPRWLSSVIVTCHPELGAPV